MTAQTILPANTLSSGYDVDNSVRFNDGDSAYMHKTAAAGNRRTFTFSTWFKRGQLGTNQQLFNSYSAANAGGFGYMQLEAIESGVIGDRISLEVYGTILLKTNQVLRDPSAWYHLVIAVDTTNGTANNRCRMYLNGTEITSFATRNNPDQNFDFAFNQNNVDMYLGSNNYGGNKGNYFDGYMAEVVWIDGTQYAASDFGEFDDDSGIWKPIDVSGLTFGTNGFYLDFEASGNLGNDVNGGTDLTEVNLAATDQSTDTCTNNFCTMNPLANKITAATFSEGNLITSFANGRGACTSTFGLTTGKWYVEMNITTMPKDERFGLGISPFETKAEDLPHEVNNQGLNLSGYNAVIYANLDDGSQVIDNFFGNNTTRFDSFTGIIGMALDLTSATKTIAFSKAGEWVTGGGTSDTDFSNALKVDISTAFARHDAWHVAHGTGNGDGTNGIFSMNFGSPAFAGTDQSDGNGFGSFEYAVPSGYLALCTKNLASTGG